MAKLERQSIIDTALDLMDEVGLDKLSTRTLAGELGVKSPALYWHFPSKRHLLDAMAERMSAAQDQPPPLMPGGDVAVWLTGQGEVFRRVLLSHRDGARVHAGTTPPVSSLPTLESKVRALTEAGMPTDHALRALLAISRYTIGWVLEEQADAARDIHQHHPDALDAYPTLRQGRHVFDRRNADENYHHGLAALVAGLTRAPS